MNFNFNTKLKKIEDVQNDFLDIDYSNEWKNLNFGSGFSQTKIGNSVTSTHLNQLVQPCKNLVSLGGKRWRPLFMVLCCEAEVESAQNKNAIELAYKMTPIVEMVHTASLIHDDIEDGADTRREKPSAHIVYGLDTAINAASWLYFSAFSVIEKNCTKENFGDEITACKMKNQFYALLSEQLRRLHLGQAMDIYWHKNPSVIPSQSEYSSMVRMKTGTLASLASQAGILCALGDVQKQMQIAQIAENIGEGFQILDDIINITFGNVGKKRGDDIVEGKKSLPVIFHLEEKKSDEKILLDCFNQASKEGIESPSVEKAIEILHSSNCIEKAKNYAQNLIESSCSNVKQLWNNNDSSLQIEQLFMSMLG